MSHLSETGIVQNYDNGGVTPSEFRISLIRWLCSATESELDVLVAELLEGFEGSKD